MISVQNRLQRLSGNKIIFFVIGLMFLSACSPKTVPTTRRTPEPSPKEKPVKEEPVKELQKPVEKVDEHPEMIISLLLPFELNSIDYHSASANDLRKAEIGIDFYQGFKMALDSIAHHSDAKFRLQVYDSKDDPSQVGTLASKDGVRKSALIVGPIFPNGIKAFSYYSKALEQPMVSPLAASDPELFKNPYLISINNSLEQHTYKAVNFIKTQLKPKKVILVRSGQSDEYKYAVPFKKGMDSLAKGLPFSEIGIKAVGYEHVYKSLNPTGLNVIVLPATDRFFLMAILKKLDELSSTYQIAVIGHPGWEKAAFLDFNQLERLNTYITSAYQVDYKSARNADFVKYYRSNYSLEPSEYAFKGFDIGYYFGMLMEKYNKNFLKEMTKQPFDGIHNDFNFSKNDQFGYYNTSLMVLKYQYGELKKVN